MKTNVIRFPAVHAKTGLSRPTIWRLEQAGKFPKRIKISAGAVGWFLADIDIWLQERAGRPIPEELEVNPTQLDKKVG